MEELWAGGSDIRASAAVLPQNSCVTLGRSPNLSGPRFPVQ